MSKAIIIFADGSKQMAHNVDDSRFRWYERKRLGYEEVVEAQQDGFVIRDTINPPSLNIARIWKSELASQQASIVSQLTILKFGAEYHDSYKQDKALLVLAKVAIEAELTNVNGYIKSEEAKADKAKTIAINNSIAKREQSDRERTEQIKLRSQMSSGMTPDQRFEIARLREERIAKEQQSADREYNDKLKKENAKLREQLVVAQSDVIVLQKILLEQFNIVVDLNQDKAS